MIQNLGSGRGKVPAESFIGTLRNFVVYFGGSKFHSGLKQERVYKYSIDVRKSGSCHYTDLLCEWQDYEFNRVWLGMREINDSQFCFYLPWRQSSELKVWMPRSRIYIHVIVVFK